MNLGVVCSSRDLFGSDRSAVRLAIVLRSLGAEAKLVLPSHRPERGLTSYAQAHDLRVEIGAMTLATRRGLERPFRSGPACDCGSAVFNTSAVIAAKGAHSPYILMIREWLDAGNPFHRLLVAWHRSRSSLAVCISHGVLGQWRAAGGTGHATVVPNWLDEDWFVKAQERRDDGMILCVGRFNGWKGQEVLAEAWKQAFSSSKDPPRLTFVGAEDFDPRFRARADELRTGAAAYGWEVVPFDTNIRCWYDRAGLLVVPSLHPEPFGMVILEALARGCRVIAFPGGGPADLSAHVSGDALRVVPRSVEALREALLAWASSGGGGQPAAAIDHTLGAIASVYSPAAARAAWSEILARNQALGRAA